MLAPAVTTNSVPSSVHVPWFLIAQIDYTQFSQAEAIAAWRPLVLHAALIVIYLIFIFEFYRFIARRDIFSLRLRRYSTSWLGRGIEIIRNFFRVILYLVEYVVIYPVLTIVWYIFYTALFALLSQGIDIQTVLLISMAVVTSIRVTAYYSENLSQDLAKMLPLAMLGGLLLDGGAGVSLEATLSLALQLPTYWQTVIYYLAFLIPLEFVLRIARILVTRRLQTVADDSSSPPPAFSSPQVEDDSGEDS